MSNTSATGGPLSPLAPFPDVGQPVLRTLQQLIAAITGLDPTLVRPRWQAEPGNVPDFGVAWCAIGIQRRDTQGFASEGFQADGSYRVDRQEEFTLLCSFYDNGVDQQADYFATLLRDAMQVHQNSETLIPAGLGYTGNGAMTPVPSLLKQRWQYRVDLPLRFRRQISWTFPVLSVESVSAEFSGQTDSGNLISETLTVPAS